MSIKLYCKYIIKKPAFYIDRNSQEVLGPTSGDAIVRIDTKVHVIIDMLHAERYPLRQRNFAVLSFAPLFGVVSGTLDRDKWNFVNITPAKPCDPVIGLLFFHGHPPVLLIN